MAKKTYFVILGSSGAPARQLGISNRLLAVALACGLVVTVALGYLAYGYLRLTSGTGSTAVLVDRIQSQEQEIGLQRTQIQKFAVEINHLKNRLMELGSLEKKIRIIAGIDRNEGRESLFGVGGAPPEDLNTRVSLKTQHNPLIREMHHQTGQLREAAARQEDNLQALLKSLKNRVNLLAVTPSIRPTSGGVVTCGFGNRQSPFTNLTEFHQGMDIANTKGAPILATAGGTVTFAGEKAFLGQMVVIDHGHGMVTRYAHVQKALVKEGVKVKRGDVIALVGDTGRTTGPHVHYEVVLNGMPVNPEKYILN